MRVILFAVSLFFVAVSFGQDKQLLQKQLTQIMNDYPNQFRNLRSKTDSSFLSFDITGTEKGALVFDFDKNNYITTFLTTPGSDAEAKQLFDKWVTLISSINLNGANLVTKPYELGEYEVYCHQWKIDNSKNNIAANFLSFTIEVMILNFQGAYAAGLKIGDFR